MAEETQVLTLQQRMAALNMAHMHRLPGEKSVPIPAPKPQFMVQRPPPIRHKSINNPPAQIHGSVADTQTGNLPNGPPPLPERKQPPPLPTRKITQDAVRKSSVVSCASSTQDESQDNRLTTTRSKSDDSVRKMSAPAWGQVELPALPDKKPQTAGRKFSADKPKYINRVLSSTPSPSPPITPARQASQSPSRPSLPPRLPSRKPELAHVDLPPPKAKPESTLPQVVLPQKPRRSALEFGMNKPVPVPEPQTEARPEAIPQLPTKPSITNTPNPPPVPLSSRPDFSQKSQAAVRSTPIVNGISKECMVCRDFSGPDHYASLFPRQQVSSIQSLAQQLTSPFPSATDKARAIFTWLHHNIRYDVDAFFSGNVRGSTPQSTLNSGLAVCEGYAGLFTGIATYAGLESMVVTGHGKGFGYQHLAPGARPPPYAGNHAWNAVKIDNGEWKLIDSCWGAGHVQGAGQPYQQKFSPDFFTMSNEEFGIKHFPENKDHFFLPGGRRLTWDEYIRINPATWPDVCETPTVFTNAREDYGIGEKTVLPRNRAISISQPNTVRFQFGLLCPHWTLSKHTRKGLPPVYLVQISGRDGRNQDLIPLEHVKPSSVTGEDEGGDLWYVDIPARDLGAPGQTLTIFAVKTFGDRHDCRGLTVREFKQGKGKVGMSFTGVAAWDLVR